MYAPLERLQAMRPVLKVMMVATGLAAAFAIAMAAVAARIAATSGPDAQASSGMYACGDSLLFIGVFACAAVPATAAALFFLRPHPRFWRIASILALAIAATSVTALALFLFGRLPQAGKGIATLGAFAVLRMLVAPVMAGAFFLGCLISPYRGARWTFFAASAMEAAVSITITIIWTAPFRQF